MNLSLCDQQDFGGVQHPPSCLPPKLGPAQFIGKDPFPAKARSSCVGHGRGEEEGDSENSSLLVLPCPQG